LTHPTSARAKPPPAKKAGNWDAIASDDPWARDSGYSDESPFWRREADDQDVDLNALNRDLQGDLVHIRCPLCYTRQPAAHINDPSTRLRAGAVTRSA
jgi:hypothetical protein